MKWKINNNEYYILNLLYKIDIFLIRLFKNKYDSYLINIQH